MRAQLCVSSIASRRTTLSIHLKVILQIRARFLADFTSFCQLFLFARALTHITLIMCPYFFLELLFHLRIRFRNIYYKTWCEKKSLLQSAIKEQLGRYFYASYRQTFFLSNFISHTGTEFKDDRVWRRRSSDFLVFTYNFTSFSRDGSNISKRKMDRWNDLVKGSVSGISPLKEKSVWLAFRCLPETPPESSVRRHSARATHFPWPISLGIGPKTSPTLPGWGVIPSVAANPHAVPCQ